MTTPPGLFTPGGRTGLADVSGVRPLVPKEWLKAHPLTRRWNAACSTNGPPPSFENNAIDLSDGFEGIIEYFAARHGAGLQPGNNSATGWAILINSVPVYQTFWTAGNGAPTQVDTAGRFDYIHAGDGLGNSWGLLDLPIEDNGVVSVRVESGSGIQDIAWSMWGLYWPVSLRQEWLVRGWRK